MKRWFIFALCVVFLLGVAGCGADKSPNTSIIEGQSTADETDRAINNNLSTADDVLVSDNTEESTIQEQEQIENIQICIRIGKITLYADMYDNELAKEFVSLIPQTISMQRVGGGQEFYGSLDGSLNYDKADSQTTIHSNIRR